MTPPKDRSPREVELSEQLLEEQVHKTHAERLKFERETALTEFEVLEYERQERNAKAKHSEAYVYNFVDQVSTSSVKSAIGTLAEWVRRKHQEGDERPIQLIFNSPGGNVFAGLALYDALKDIQNKEHVEIVTVARGMAASMAGILLQAGSKRIISENSWILIHEVSDIASGTTSELEDEVMLTKRLQKRLINILAERSTMTDKQIDKKWKRKDWWLEAQEAVDLGFADEVG